MMIITTSSLIAEDVDYAGTVEEKEQHPFSCFLLIICFVV